MSAPDDVRVEWLEVAGDPATWRGLGLVVGPDGLVPFMGTSLRVVEGAPGLRALALSGLPAGTEAIDGVPVRPVPPTPPAMADHPLGAIGIDHVVLLTDSLERTCGAVADVTGAPLKRIREVSPSMRQGFHRIGARGLVVEVVERAELAGAVGAVPWGFVLDVEDLDAAVSLLGPERIRAARDAVQPGRRIATVREQVGLGVPLALMSLSTR